jgi:hypothetical protein
MGMLLELLSNARALNPSVERNKIRSGGTL